MQEAVPASLKLADLIPNSNRLKIFRIVLPDSRSPHIVASHYGENALGRSRDRCYIGCDYHFACLDRSHRGTVDDSFAAPVIRQLALPEAE